MRNRLSLLLWLLTIVFIHSCTSLFSNPDKPKENNPDRYALARQASLKRTQRVLQKSEIMDMLTKPQASSDSSAKPHRDTPARNLVTEAWRKLRDGKAGINDTIQGNDGRVGPCTYLIMALSTPTFNSTPIDEAFIGHLLDAGADVTKKSKFLRGDPEVSPVVLAIENGLPLSMVDTMIARGASLGEALVEAAGRNVTMLQGLLDAQPDEDLRKHINHMHKSTGIAVERTTLDALNAAADTEAHKKAEEKYKAAIARVTALGGKTRAELLKDQKGSD